jgi:hypothetical protein
MQIPRLRREMRPIYERLGIVQPRPMVEEAAES